MTRAEDPSQIVNVFVLGVRGERAAFAYYGHLATTSVYNQSLCIALHKIAGRSHATS